MFTGVVLDPLRRAGGMNTTSPTVIRSHALVGCQHARWAPLAKGVPVRTDGATNEPIVFLAIRLPKSLKKRLQVAALDDDTSAQAITHAAIEEYLDRRAKAQSRQRSTPR